MPAYWVDQLADALNQARKAVNGSRVLILGVTYKPNVDDVRESPALDIIQLLEARGAQVCFHDPFVNSLRHEGLETPFVELDEAHVAAADCVMIGADPASYAWAWCKGHAALIVDTRHALRALKETRAAQGGGHSPGGVRPHECGAVL